MSFGVATIDSTSNLPLFVVDASVAVKWSLRDEADIEIADRVLDDYRQGRIALVAPNHIRYEVPSAIRNAVRKGRETPQAGKLAVARLLALAIPIVDDDLLIQASFDQALRFGCSLYDGLYVALAENIGCPLIHADGRLRNAMGTGFPQALWLTDYVPRG